MKLKTFSAVLYSILLHSCASVVPPSGGPVDPKPPEINKQSPAQGAINFKGDELVLEFDEYLAPINDPSSIIISPSLNKSPEVNVRKRKITLRFTEKLQPSTTYTVNFGDNIKDNHEGNPLSNFTVVFSTGAYIDSGFISGVVVDAKDLTVQKDLSVLLYPDLSDTAVLKRKPSYVSKTDLNGLYFFRNLPAGNYKVYALKDENKNLMLDHSELFGFLSQSIEIKGDSVKAPKLYVNTYRDKEAIQVTRNRRSDELIYTFGFNQDISDSLINIKPALQEQGTSLQVQRNGSDSVWFYYYPSVKTDSVYLSVFAGKRLITSFTYDFPKAVQSAFNLNLHKAINTPFDTLILSSGQPIKLINKDKAQLLEKDSIPIDFNILRNPSDPYQLFVLFQKKEGLKYSLSIADSSIQSIFNNYNRRFKTGITVLEEKRFGSLNISIENKNNNSLIIFILDKKKQAIRTYYTKSDFKIEESWFPAGDYMLKVIWDKNGNNRFDMSEFQSNTQTEPVYIYPNNIVIKSNWEVSDLRITPVFE